MRKCIRQKTTSLLLSALVLAWGIVPPGVEHSHAGGSDATHGHEHHHEVAHHGSHDHDFSDQHCESEPLPQVSLLADSVRHLHWRFLGMKFSMPAPGQPTDNGDDQGDLPPAIVCGVDEGVLAMHTGPAFARTLLFGICEPSIDVVCGMRPIPPSPNLVTTMPLCDSARLERSGVLLA